jgi:hypothetical protein
MGSASMTARRFLLHQNVVISFLVVPFFSRIGFVYFPVDVRGTAQRTSSCTDCGLRLQATHHEWVWSHRCLEHQHICCKSE